MSIEISLTNSPIQNISFNGVDFLLKRDDLLHEDFSGNKARKFTYFLQNDFAHIDTIISHGSNQSNAMYSLSVLAKIKRWKFKYYTNHISSFLKENPIGNYKYALLNGMSIFENEPPTEFNKNELFIKEGGAVNEASVGLKNLANELNSHESYDIFLPSGTGTTALFLQKYSKNRVFTCACVGDEAYLKKQFFELESDEKFHPTILKTPKKYHFGKLYTELYEIWQKLKSETNIEFDLLYDPIGWITLLNSDIIEKKLIYIHQGGLLGNESLLQRYKRFAS